MEFDPDYPEINIPEPEPEPEPVEEQKDNEEKFFNNIKSSKDARLENLKKAREARAKKRLEKSIKFEEPEPEPELKKEKEQEINYDYIINNIVDKLEDNKKKRKETKKIKQIETPTAEYNIYDGLFYKNL
jgi:hypothetical protein